LVQFDNKLRQIKIKVVYYGPALGGKTTSLQYIHRATDPHRRTQLYSLNTANDRTIFFDLMAVTLGRIRGHQLTLQLCTVPGQVHYNATRRAVLSGVDAVVFTADAQLDQREANLESRTNLDANLRANGVKVETIPIVYQFNKQDLAPLIPSADLNDDINPDGAPFFLTTATTGRGVMEAFIAVTERVLAAVADKLGLGESSKALARLQDHAKRSLVPYLGVDGLSTAVAEEPAVVRTDASDEVWPLPQDELVQQAVQANLAMTDLNAGLDTLGRQLKRKVGVLEAIGRFGVTLGAARDPGEILEDLMSSACTHIQAQAGTVLLFSDGALKPFHVRGCERDPLLSATSTTGISVAAELFETKTAVLIAPDAGETDPGELEYTVEEAGYSSAIAVPLVARDEILGLVTLYGGIDRLPFEEEDLQLASSVASSAALAYANALNWSRIENMNQELEIIVADRTVKLQHSLDEVKNLNLDLTEQHLLLKRAYQDLEEVDRLKHEILTRVSHELRTPVTSLRSAAGILGRYQEMAPEESAKFVTIIQEGAQRLSEVIDAVVQASALAASAEGPEKVDVELKELFKQAISPLKEFAASRKVTIRVAARGGVTAVPCDLDTMGSALRAVIKNAVEFNKEGGEVDVDVRPVQTESGRSISISVRDSGAGIPEEDLPRVFDVFWQGGDLMTGKPRGIGLGLVIANRVAEAHGGTLKLSSTVGEGTVASFSIPA